ncbi:MAG TPA: S9 family peptidase [Burkholderiaceae bacterium]|nr:S9 family peptidase [Burkholderiaceae bacterium]
MIEASEGAGALPARYPIRDFFKNPQRGSFRLSDDGATLGFMEPVSIDGKPPRMNVFIQTLAGSTPTGASRRLTAETERDVSGFFWKGNDTILYEKDFNGDENFHVVAVDTASGAITDLTPFPGVRAGVQDDLEDDPDHILISHNKRRAEVFDVYRANLRTGELALVAENPGNIVGWQADHEGRIRAAIASDGLNTTVLYRNDESQPFRPIIHTDFRTSVGPLFFTFDNRSLYALSNRGRDCLALVVIDPERPDDERLVYQTPEVDLDGASYSRLRKVLTEASFNTDRPHHHFFDDVAARRHEDLRARLPGYEVALQSASRDEAKFIVAAYNDRTPGARYLYDAENRTLDKLADINPALQEADMAPVRPVTYTARDGLTIHGYLTLPPGRPARALPCVINPHGGPWARDHWGFNPEAQFLANRGYAVLQMNFRGSTGYGRKFWEASFGQWGLAMQDDVTDGVRWLIDQGIADPARIAIYGGSYGGYATLSGIVGTPDLYAAAIDYVGVSNLLTFMNTIPPYWKPMLEKMHCMVGDPVHDRDRLVATSPALNADRIRTPLFIAQGAHDPRVNKAESDQMVAALKKRGVDVDYLVKDNEGHGFHNDENKFEFYERMEAFLDKHLGPRG